MTKTDRITRRQALSRTAAFVGLAANGRGSSSDGVRLVKVPGGGIQPQIALDRDGATHLVYYGGDPRQGNLYYTRSLDFGATFSPALCVNSQDGSAIAAGTIRGAQIAVGKAGRVHVAWNGSGKAEPRGPLNPESGKAGEPMLYARLGDQFEAQRNLMHHSFGLDGGGAITADQSGNVYVAWHGIGESEARGTGKEGEARRAVWLTKSGDDGKSFSTEAKVWSRETGACGCCGMKIFADSKGEIFALYRSATESVHRDIYLLNSKDGGRTFQGGLLHKWEINACPMSSMDFAEGGGIVAAAWETGGQVFWTRANSEERVSVAAPGAAKGRKHPRVAVNQRGEVLLVWTEGTGWQKGGGLAWQLYDRTGRPTGGTHQLPGIPVWSFAAAVTRPDNGFTVLF